MNQCNQVSEPHGDVNQGLDRLYFSLTELERVHGLLAQRLESVTVSQAVAGAAPDSKAPERTRSTIGQQLFNIEARVSNLAAVIGYQLDTLQL